jgi:hypothetical protein
MWSVNNCGADNFFPPTCLASRLSQFLEIYVTTTSSSHATPFFPLIARREELVPA